MDRKLTIGQCVRGLSLFRNRRVSARGRSAKKVPRLFVLVVAILGLAIGGGAPVAYKFVFTAEAEAETRQVAVGDIEEERCKWQQDVAFFTSLDGKTQPTLQTGVVCEKKDDVVPVVATKKESLGDHDLDRAIRELSAGYPLEVMAPAIARYDKEVAGLIVGIAKKESNWGKRVPLDTNGDDCFNYWGYKGAGSRGIAMGHGCFGTPEEAVEAVGNRLAELVKIKQTSEPKHLTIWKCGSSCATHSSASVLKWVSDVDLYYQKIAKN